MLFFLHNKIKYNFILYILFSTFLFSIEKCEDENCENCSSDGTYCYICKKNLIKFQNRCLKKCKTIKNCVLSYVEEKICLKCDYGCKTHNKICTCTLKYILYGVYLLIIVITVGTFLYCLTHNTLAKYSNFSYIHPHIRFRPFNEVNINNNNIDINNSIRQLNNNNNNININEMRKTEEELLNEFLNSKIDIDDNIDIENKKCDCCNNIICNLFLDCGCYVCFDCEKKSIKENYCLNCHKEFSLMKQVSCSICLNNKKELGFFNCKCKMVVCKDCYIKWRIDNKNCPTCRAIII
jgi:hypothetical protein